MRDGEPPAEIAGRCPRGSWGGCDGDPGEVIRCETPVTAPFHAAGKILNPPKIECSGAVAGFRTVPGADVEGVLAPGRAGGRCLATWLEGIETLPERPEKNRASLLLSGIF